MEVILTHLLYDSNTAATLYRLDISGENMIYVYLKSSDNYRKKIDNNRKNLGSLTSLTKYIFVILHLNNT